MSLDKAQIEKIAWLARLAMIEDSLPDYQHDLGNILELVEQIKNVDTEAVAPLAHPVEIMARLRRDEITETDQREKFQQLAPAVAEGHYLVPKVIE